MFFRKYLLPTTTYLFGIFLCGSLLYRCSNQSNQTNDRVITNDPKMIAQGEQLFQENCSACHNFRQRAIGPQLSGITTETEPNWLFHFIRNAPEMIEGGNQRAVQLYEEYQTYMPPFSALDSMEIEAIMGYLHTQQQVNAPSNLAETGDFLEDPIPEKIQYSGISLVIEEVAQAPVTAQDPPLARINKLLTLKAGGRERMFIHDLQGILYELKENTFHTFLDIRKEKPNFINKPGLGTGLGSFAFHPEFEQNGIFYTTHTEPPGTAPADFAYDDSIKVTLQWVLSEWKMDNPKSKTFSGSNRELLRANMVGSIHGVQEITFNPLAVPGDVDYGMLYMGTGDGGAMLAGYPFLCQSMERIWGTIIRIDPQGSNSKNGQYGIPEDNPFVDIKSPKVVKEIWAYGFRNPHRISWDTGSDGKMLITNIGQTNIESIYLGKAGANYGWGSREGTFMLQGNIDQAYNLPENDPDLSYTYPVAQYDHDEGKAISGGFVYRGDLVPQLNGKYIFGDIVTGRLFYVEGNKLAAGHQEPILELGLQVNGQETTWREVTDNNRVDLRFGIGAEEELYIFTKADGKVWKVVNVAGKYISAVE
ncbi:PQQ-dependent sugar dehydrogenase [Catalinimonas niigatensis]|uniref:PQQ-dependent sugar dehydrogenase n=1 Tax=Catalinimonas niigatensis TaxID=1397264 RepID=UPI002666E51D|nr:PQQ-dependent sugar dehydrogenase [Catalinimonas niigatensis]WPP48666.1 PQQ-dependent sugar dehydrogenase [Catalinimonas niigatensis]